MQECRISVDIEFLAHPKVKYSYTLGCPDFHRKFSEEIAINADGTFGKYERKGKWLFDGFIIIDNTQSTDTITRFWKLSILADTDYFSVGVQRMVFNLEERTTYGLEVVSGLLFRPKSK